MVKSTVVTYPEDLPQLLKVSDAEFGQILAFLAAAKLYELGKLFAGKAAQLVSMERLTFLEHLADVEVPAINLRDEEIEAELEAARDL
jgi:predicted HTH domain antitoxin